MFLRRSLVIHPQRAVKTALANAEHRLTADARSSGEAVTTQPQRGFSELTLQRQPPQRTEK